MLMEEFKARTDRAFTPKDYRIIEFVYMYHPAFTGVYAKDAVADLFTAYGMRIIYDMIPAAKKGKILEEKIQACSQELSKLRAEYDELKSGGAVCPEQGLSKDEW